MSRSLLLFVVCLVLSGSCSANQMSTLKKFIKSHRLKPDPRFEEQQEQDGVFEVFLEAQDGKMEADKIKTLPGQPDQGVDFDQYGGYVTVDPKNGRALFYYFVESSLNPSTKPLMLWLNGGPGCSSLGYGAMEELGPFRVNSDGKTLYRNNYAWNNVANVIFLESPAGVGFSYSNTSSDYITGDKKTAEDSYTFLLNWLERFPQYKNRDFYIAGESYGGHYVPQLASIIISKNKNSNQTIINLKGIIIGNAWIDENTGNKGTYDYYWTHGLNSDEANAKIHKNCDFVSGNFSLTCLESMNVGDREVGRIDHYNIYAPFCNAATPPSAKEFDPCSDNYVSSYLNHAEVQTALHAKATEWAACGGKLVDYTDGQSTILPTIKLLMASGIRLWLYSGDVDSVVSVTATRYAINTFKLPVTTAWRPWYTSNEVGGYVEEYKGLTLVTVRGSGHTVPSFQPERALVMISSFLQGNLPPSSRASMSLPLLPRSLVTITLGMEVSSETDEASAAAVIEEEIRGRR